MAKERVLVIGGRGMLASYLRAELGERAVAPSREELDARDPDALRRLCREQGVGAVVSAAGAAGADRRTQFEVHALAPADQAAVCREMGMRFVFLSTGRVFSGAPGRPHLESDAPDPRDDYGMSKHLGEKLAARELEPGALVVLRLPMLLGVRERNPEGQLLNRLMAAGRRDGEVLAARDVVNTPLHAADAARLLVRLLDSPDGSGLYHLASGEAVALSDLVSYAFARAGMAARVIPVDAVDLPGGKDAPRNLAMGSERLAVPAGWQAAVDRFVAEERRREGRA